MLPRASGSLALLGLLLVVTASACAAPPEEDVGDTSGAASKGSSSSDVMNKPLTSRYFGDIKDGAGKPLEGVTIVAGCPTLANPTIASGEYVSKTDGFFSLVLEAKKVTSCETKLVRGGKSSRKFLLIAGPPLLETHIRLFDDGTLAGVEMFPE